MKTTPIWGRFSTVPPAFSRRLELLHFSSYAKTNWYRRLTVKSARADLP
jgi:hypothetical protein